MPETIVAITDSWGPAKGGINAFNTDFCKAVGRVAAGRLDVVCVVDGAAEEDVADAKADGVRLLAAGPTEGDTRLGAGLVVDTLRAHGIDPAAVTWWVGHDVISGPAACDAAKAAGGRAALIRHMIYRRYQAAKSNDPDDANRRHDEQRQLFERCDQPFAVGPLMRDETDLFYTREDPRQVVQLVPGLAALEPRRRAAYSLDGITFGRINARDDVIKQGRLASAAFARASEQIREATTAPIQFSFQLYGLSDDKDANAGERAALDKIIRENASRWMSVLDGRYTLDRESLLRDMSEKHLCLMLSLHEGFGLTGWEAIAAAVPLVVSRNSGLYQFLHDLALQDQVAHVQLHGPAGDDKINPDDVKQVADAIQRVHNDRDNWMRRAADLLQTLREKHGITWGNTARTFLEGLGVSLEDQPPVPSADKSPASPVLGPTSLSARRPQLMTALEDWFATTEAPVLSVTGPGNSANTLVSEWSFDKVDNNGWQIATVDAATAKLDETLFLLIAGENRKSGDAWETIASHFAENSSIIVVKDMEALDGRSLPKGLRVLMTLADSGRLGKSRVILAGRAMPEDLTGIGDFRRLEIPKEGSDDRDALAVRLTGLDALQRDLLEQLALLRFGLPLTELMRTTTCADRLAMNVEVLRSRDLVSEPHPGLLRATPMVAEHVRATLQRSRKRKVHDSLAKTLWPRADRRAQPEATPESLWTAMEWAHHTLNAGREAAAFRFVYDRLRESLYYRHGRYDLYLDLLRPFFPDRRLPAPLLKAHDLKAKALLYTGLCLGQLGRPTEALQFIDEHNELREDKSELYELAQGHGAKALFLYSLGRYQETHHHLTQRERLSHEKLAKVRVGTPIYTALLLSLAVSHRTLAKLLIAQEKWEEAEAHLNLAEQTYRKAGDDDGLVGCLVYRARICLLRDQSPVTAASFLAQARGILERTSGEADRRRRADARDVIAVTLLEADIRLSTSESGPAEHLAQQAVSRAQSMTCVDLEVDALTTLARTRLRLGTIDQAKLSAQRALEQATTSGYRYKEAEVLAALARIEAQDGAMERAAELLAKATELATVEPPSHEPKRLIRLLEHVRCELTA